MRHLQVLNKLQEEFLHDENVLALLVFGSVAVGNFHAGSDIDLTMVYGEYDLGFQLETAVIDDISVGFSRWSLLHLRKRTEISPYKMHVFANVRVLFDKADVGALQQKVRTYFSAHPEIEREWEELSATYEQEKRLYGHGRTNIFDTYSSLDFKYGRGGPSETGP